MATQQQTLLDISGLKTELGNLETKISDLQAQQTLTNTAIAALGTSVTGEIAAVNAEIANLEQQIQNGTGITQADIDALKDRVVTAQTNIAAQVDQVKAAAGAIGGDQASLDTETQTVGQIGTGGGSSPASSQATTVPAAPATTGPLVHS